MKLSTIIKGAEYTLQLPLEILRKSNEQIAKELHLSSPWEDKMVFSPSEIAFYKDEHAKVIDDRQNFEVALSTITVDVVWAGHVETKANLKPVMNKALQLRNMRAGALFPAGDKKSVVQFRRKPLIEKISSMTLQTYSKLYCPSHLNDRMLGRVKPIISAEPDVIRENISSIKAFIEKTKLRDTEKGMVMDYLSIIEDKFKDIDEEPDWLEEAKRAYKPPPASRRGRGRMTAGRVPRYFADETLTHQDYENPDEEE
jgi:hypothetical protein